MDSGPSTAVALLESAIAERGTPALAVLTYASFHDARNTYGRWRWKGLFANQKHSLAQPYARLDADGKLLYAMRSPRFRSAPLMRHSAFSHLLEKA